MSSIRIWTIHGAYSAPVSHPHKPRKWLKKEEEEEKKLIRRSPGFRIYKRWSISSEETPESMKITWFDLQVILLIERAGKEHLRPLFFILFYYHSFFIGNSHVQVDGFKFNLWICIASDQRRHITWMNWQGRKTPPQAHETNPIGIGPT